MTKTTKLISVSIPVADQDAALRFYTEVLGCELEVDQEIMPGGRLVQVRPPGSPVSLALLLPDGPIPVAVRLGTGDADEAFVRVARAGVRVHNEEVLRWPGVPPMFSFEDVDGNGLVYLQDE
ncbi:VOC family protein [Cumulibacter manganitolerans]|uniref:VOC family protein n=1 Tax=Cumulibacter manganitolerans TaxID=1884992 RepID=UPI0012959CED|nr:VOC family protein [Cumulibacter manganitolerans]